MTAAKRRARGAFGKMRESGTEDGCGTGGGNGRQAAAPPRPAPRPRPQLRTLAPEAAKVPARRGGSRATQAGAGCKNPAAAAPLRFFFRREACVKILRPPPTAFPRTAPQPKNGGGRGGNDRKSPAFPHFRTVILPSENADFARADQHAHRIRHRRSGAPTASAISRIAHERRLAPYPFPEVFIYPLGGGFNSS